MRYCLKVNIIEGDLLKQPVDVIINPWNRNFIPWWLLMPQGVSGAIKKQAGLMPFAELSKHGVIKLGGAVVTGAGKLPFKIIIHVAGINSFWLATRYSIQQSIFSAMDIINKGKYVTAAFPIIGSGTGMCSKEKALKFMLEAFDNIDSEVEVTIVRYSCN